MTTLEVLVRRYLQARRGPRAGQRAAMRAIVEHLEQLDARRDAALRELAEIGQEIQPEHYGRSR